MTSPFSRFSSLAFSLMLISGLNGCAKTDSDNVKTEGISAKFYVTDESDDENSPAVIEATLYSGSGIGGTELELSDGDRLMAYADGEEYTLQKADDIIRTYYTVDIPNANINTEYQVSFEREEDTSAPYSVTTLPEEFTITTENNVQFYINEESTITWSPAGNDQIKLSLTLDCPDDSNTHASFYESFDDDGSISFKLADLISEEYGDRVYTECSGELYLVREKTNSVDPAFGEGGVIRGQQSRSISVSFSQASSQ